MKNTDILRIELNILNLFKKINWMQKIRKVKSILRIWKLPKGFKRTDLKLEILYL